jgi:DNA segregation ATPase FtsK/SpoIIIE, S-DNA-T family
MTEKGKKPGAEAAGQSDPLSATGMFLNAFGTQPEPPVEQESPPQGTANAAPPGEFTQMFHKLESPPPSPPPQTRSTSIPEQEPGEFTRMFVAAATSPGVRPAPATPAPAPFAPPPTPKLRGFSAPGISDSASAEGSFTQLFRTPPSLPQAPPVQPFTPLPSAPPPAAEPAWPQNLDPAPNREAMAPGGLSQLFRSLSEESGPPPKRIEESFLVREAAPPAQPAASNPASVTMLIQRLTEDLKEPAASTPPTPQAAAPAGLSGPGEFTRIMAGGVANPASGLEPGVAAGNFAMPAAPTLVFPSALPAAPAFAAPQVPAAPAPAFAAPQIPAIAAPQAPPAQPPKVAASAAPPQSKLQQMLPMLLVLNAFLVVVLILLLVFALKSR